MGASVVSYQVTYVVPCHGFVVSSIVKLGVCRSMLFGNIYLENNKNVNFRD
jgi:hypothetical protein